MDRQELAGFLRSRRERIAPADVGLPAGRRRRTPGLRREEVAQLAFMSTEYYTRLEQGRAPRPSREVRPSILDLLARLPQAAATVISAGFEVIAWNDLAAALMEDFSALPRRDRNLVRKAFLGDRNVYGVSDAETFGRRSAMQLRAAAARYPDDPELAALVRELLDGSAAFRELWESHDVSDQPTMVKTFRHPLVGPITVNCDVLDIADRDQRLVIYTAAPGSPSEEALRLLSVIGTQRMSVEGDGVDEQARVVR